MAALAACTVLAASSGVRAWEHAPPPAQDPSAPLALKRAEVLRLGAERGPQVIEALAMRPAAAGIRESANAALSYAPRAQMIAGRRSGDFGAGPEVSATLVQELSLRGLGSARTDVGASVDRVVRSEIEHARLESAGAAVLAWLDLLEAQEMLRLRALARASAEGISRVAHARVARGVGLPLESSLAESEVGASELAGRYAEGQVFEAAARLRYAMGMPPARPVTADGDLYATDELRTREPSPVREHPATLVARDRVGLTRAEVDLAHAYGAPTIGLGIGYTREGTGQQIVTGSISVPIPLLDPTRFDTARQQANVAAAQASERRVRAEIARDLELAEHECFHTREVRDALQTKVVTALREGVRVTRANYEAGIADVTSLLIVRQRLVAAEEQLGHASADVQRADVRLALARGTLLDEISR